MIVFSARNRKRIAEKYFLSMKSGWEPKEKLTCLSRENSIRSSKVPIRRPGLNRQKQKGPP